MKFSIVEISGGEKMYAGQVIRYKITVLPLVRVSWVTEITQVQEPSFFIDEQRLGPYKWWHHQHHFREAPGGVEMTDDVKYLLPMGILGRFANALFVSRQLNSIFDYRHKVLQDFFRPKTVRKPG
jgi:ligand-binding SRPBCC domain-containing protein